MGHEQLVKEKYVWSFMQIAKIMGEQSTCTRAKIGCVIVKDNNILVTGYNGTVAGMDNNCNVIGRKMILKRQCTDYPKCDYTSKVNLSEVSGELTEDLRHIACPKCGNGIVASSIENEEYETTSPFVVHAEENAIIQCAKRGLSAEGASLFTSLSPCERCARMIHSVGIKEVYYMETHDNGEGVKWLAEEAKIYVRKIMHPAQNVDIHYPEAERERLGLKRFLLILVETKGWKKVAKSEADTLEEAVYLINKHLPNACNVSGDPIFISVAVKEGKAILIDHTDSYKLVVQERKDIDEERAKIFFEN